MPTMDLSLGFHQVAKYYYFPGWHQQTSITQLYLSEKKWEELSDAQKAIIEQACKANMMEEYAEAEALQFGAMQELKKKGVELRRWSPEMLKILEEKWNEVVAEQSAKSALFKKVYESYSKFRANYAIWRENGYMN